MDSNFTKEELEAEEAFEAQLLHTVSIINNMIPDHRHFTDDCGEYLRGSLELSAELASAREEGVEELLRYFRENFTNDWPSDSTAPALDSYITAIRPDLSQD